VFEPTSERGRKLAGLAQQLRVLHNELADQTGDMRAEQLRDRVQREVGTLLPHEREAFLTELMGQFPTWNSGDNGGGKDGPARTAGAAPVEIKDPKVLVEKLIALSAGLSAGEKAGLAAKLAAAGLALPPPPAAVGGVREVPVEKIVEKIVVREVPTLAGLPEGAMAELKKMLGVPVEGTVGADRVVELCTLLVEFTIKLEPWACAYWQDIGKEAKNQVRRALSKDRPNERQGVLAKYAEGDPAVTKDVVARDILKLRSLVSLLLKGVLDAGKQFSKDHMARFALDAVQAAAEKGTFTESQAAKNWKQYVKLMDGFDAGTMEKRLKSLIAKDVDSQLSQVIK